MTSHYTQGSVTTIHDFGGVLGRPLDTFFLSSHNFMVTASWLVCEVALNHTFGGVMVTGSVSCVKWPLIL